MNYGLLSVTRTDTREWSQNTLFRFGKSTDATKPKRIYDKIRLWYNILWTKKSENNVNNNNNKNRGDCGSTVQNNGKKLRCLTLPSSADGVCPVGGEGLFLSKMRTTGQNPPAEEDHMKQMKAPQQLFTVMGLVVRLSFCVNNELWM